MPRNRPRKQPTPRLILDPEVDRQLDLALAGSIDKLTEALARARAIEETTALAADTSELMAVRHLSIDDLGCWILLMTPPVGANAKAEPTVQTFGGQLVGIGPGRWDANRPPSRILVIRQGSAQSAHEWPVDHPVRVARR